MRKRSKNCKSLAQDDTELLPKLSIKFGLILNPALIPSKTVKNAGFRVKYI